MTPERSPKPAFLRKRGVQERTSCEQLGDGSEAVDELFRVYLHLLKHSEQQIAEVRLIVHGLVAEIVMRPGIRDVICADLREIVIDVLAVPEAEAATSGDDGREICIPMAVAITH